MDENNKQQSSTQTYTQSSSNFNEAKVERWWESKAVFLVTVLTPVVVILSFIFGMRQDIAVMRSDIANINTNHETHIQDLTQEIKDLHVTQVDQQKQIIDLQKQILVIITSQQK